VENLQHIPLPFAFVIHVSVFGFLAEVLYHWAIPFIQELNVR
jgi:hypothetical protein